MTRPSRALSGDHREQGIEGALEIRRHLSKPECRLSTAKLGGESRPERDGF
jgi:hypothetical protein